MNLKKYLLIAFSLFLFGCPGGGISGTGGPELPPPESMGAVDLPNEQFAHKRYKGLKLTSHYDHANVIYQTMNERIFDEMAIQSKLFESIYDIKPQKDQAEVYHWQATETGVDEIQSVDLQGKKSTSQVDWLMNILDINSIEDSLLEGTSNFNNTKGTWTVFKTKDTKVLQIAWEIKNKILTVIYTNISGNENNGDSITLILNDSDVQMTYADLSASATVIIKWNMETSAGSVIDPDFTDGQERFWNSSLENTNDTDNF
jgi:hypothetical protein